MTIALIMGVCKGCIEKQNKWYILYMCIIHNINSENEVYLEMGSCVCGDCPKRSGLQLLKAVYCRLPIPEVVISLLSIEVIR